MKMLLLLPPLRVEVHSDFYSIPIFNDAIIARVDKFLHMLLNECFCNDRDD